MFILVLNSEKNLICEQSFSSKLRINKFLLWRELDKFVYTHLTNNEGTPSQPYFMTEYFTVDLTLALDQRTDNYRVFSESLLIELKF